MDFSGETISENLLVFVTLFYYKILIINIYVLQT